MFPTTLRVLRRSSAQVRPFLRPLFFIGAILFYLFSSTANPSIDISSVSGYYGPGAVLAWLFALIITLITCEGGPVLFPLWTKMRKYFTKSAPTPEAEDDTELQVDTTLISIIAYPTLSVIDFLKRYRSSTGVDAQAEASVAVAKLFLASLCLLGLFGPSSFKKISHNRGTLWFLTAYLNGFVLLRMRSDKDKASFWLLMTLVMTYPLRWFLIAILNGWKWFIESFP
jgi:hypothetical protein